MVEVVQYYSKGDYETLCLTLVVDAGNLEENIVSVNSPFGNCVYNHKIGETLVYGAAGNKIKVQIQNIIKKSIVKHKCE